MNESSKKISVSKDLMMGGLNAKSDGFIVDLESVSNHISAYSRIALPRSLSRKGHQRGAGDPTTLLVAAAASVAFPPPPSPSPRATAVPTMEVVTGATGDKSQQSDPSHHHHQITVMTVGSTIPTACPDSQLASRRRSQLPWYSNPKRVFLFFATISSIGSLFLICFTLAINKPY